MSDEINLITRTPEEAHQAINYGWALAKSILQNGKAVKVHIAEDQDPITVKQRAFLHAAVFPQIAEQVVVNGDRYTAEVWKEFFRKRFLPDTWEMQKAIRWDPNLCRLVQAKRATPVRVRSSTEKLGVKAYSEHIDKVIDHAALEFGVVFVFRPNEREAVRYVGKAGKKVREEVPA